MRACLRLAPPLGHYGSVRADAIHAILIATVSQDLSV